MSSSNDGSGDTVKGIGMGAYSGEGKNHSSSYVLRQVVHEGIPAEYGYLENGFSLPNDNAMAIADSRSFNPSTECEVSINGIGKSGAFDQHRQHHLNPMDGNEEYSHREEGSSNAGVSGSVDEVVAASEGGMQPEVEAITRQAKIHVEAALDETRELANILFGELSKFLQEAVAVQEDFDQVQMAVQSEYERLDTLQPTVESATRDLLMKPGVSLL